MKRLFCLSTAVILAVLLLPITAVTASAQSFQGGLRGAVKDANGVIPGATVTLINEGTNVSRTTVSNEVGEYVFAAVAPGTYTVRAVLAGFKTFERKGITIGTQQFITLDLVMEIGSIEESVVVTGEAPLIETSNASHGRGADERDDRRSARAQPQRVHVVRRLTVPTVVASGDPYFSRMEDQTNGSLVSLGGGPRRANNYLLDGVSTTDLQNRTSVFVSSEAISEVKIQVHTYDAEMGRSGGGVFNTTGRSGSNILSRQRVRPDAALFADRGRLLRRPRRPREARRAVLSLLGWLVRRTDQAQPHVLLGRTRGLPDELERHDAAELSDRSRTRRRFQPDLRSQRQRSSSSTIR